MNRHRLPDRTSAGSAPLAAAPDPAAEPRRVRPIAPALAARLAARFERGCEGLLPGATVEVTGCERGRWAVRLTTGGRATMMLRDVPASPSPRTVRRLLEVAEVLGAPPATESSDAPATAR